MTRFFKFRLILILLVTTASCAFGQISKYNHYSKNTNGILTHVTYSNDSLHCSIDTVFIGNTVRFTFETLNGQWSGLFYEYDTTGTISSITNYVNGYVCGTEIRFHANGKLQSVGNYIDIDSVKYTTTITSKDNKGAAGPGFELHAVSIDYSKSAKHGIWLYYNNEGLLYRTEFWHIGTMTDVIQHQDK